MKNKVTIYEVAEHAGVSITTVSRVLNSPGSVSPVSKKKVLDAMKELDFVPRAEAVARARKDFRRIGVIVPFFTSPSFVQRIRGITGALSSTEYELIIYTIETQEQLRDYYVSLPVARKVDGLIILALPVDEEDVERFRVHDLPVVLVEVQHGGLSGITIDNRYGGRLAAEYLVSRGYRTMGFLGEGGQPAYSLHATDERYSGFKDALHSMGYEIRNEHAAFHEFGMENTVKAAVGLLSGSDRPDAIFAASDIEAVGVIKAARSIGLEVPGDIAVIGFDDIDLADYMGITTINQSLDESGVTAVELLLEKMRYPERTSKNITLDLKIIERFTT